MAMAEDKETTVAEEVVRTIAALEAEEAGYKAKLANPLIEDKPKAMYEARVAAVGKEIARLKKDGAVTPAPKERAVKASEKA
jgi:uncharacterized small protein (DUF1192 family)